MTKDEAIRHLCTYSSTNGSGQTTQEQHEEAKRMAIDALKQPERITGRAVYQAGYADGYNSAQSERKTGKWIRIGQKRKDGYVWMKCSMCGAEDIDSPMTRTNFCPNCGAKMEGEQP